MRPSHHPKAIVRKITRGDLRGRYRIVRDRKPIRFKWLSTFASKADAECVAYWINKERS
jgi:hypothetical protein